MGFLREVKRTGSIALLCGGSLIFCAAVNAQVPAPNQVPLSPSPPQRRIPPPPMPPSPWNMPLRPRSFSPNQVPPPMLDREWSKPDNSPKYYYALQVNGVLQQHGAFTNDWDWGRTHDAHAFPDFVEHYDAILVSTQSLEGVRVLWQFRPGFHQRKNTSTLIAPIRQASASPPPLAVPRTAQQVSPMVVVPPPPGTNPPTVTLVIRQVQYLDFPYPVPYVFECQGTRNPTNGVFLRTNIALHYFAQSNHCYVTFFSTNMSRTNLDWSEYVGQSYCPGQGTNLPAQSNVVNIPIVGMGSAFYSLRSN
jgi:hypothetical protein